MASGPAGLAPDARFNMKIAFLGTGEFAVPALRALDAAGHHVVLVISQPDRPAGRGKRIAPTPVRAAALELNLPHLPAEDANRPDVFARATDAELGVVAAFGQKLGPEWLRGLGRGCVNIHASLLPRHRGAAPFQWAILSGDPITGVTVFQLNERWDAGEIWAQHETPIGPRETADELHDRLARLGAELIVPTLAGIAAGTLTPQAQDPRRASRAPKLSKADARLDWAQPARAVVARIHGLWSWPAATCDFVAHSGRRETVQVARAELIDAATAPSASEPPGAIVGAGLVQTGAGRVRLLELKPAGGKLMTFAAFANGRQVQPPDRFEMAVGP